MFVYAQHSVPFSAHSPESLQSRVLLDHFFFLDFLTLISSIIFPFFSCYSLVFCFFTVVIFLSIPFYHLIIPFYVLLLPFHSSIQTLTLCNPFFLYPLILHLLICFLSLSFPSILYPPTLFSPLYYPSNSIPFSFDPYRAPMRCC